MARLLGCSQSSAPSLDEGWPRGNTELKISHIDRVQTICPSNFLKSFSAPPCPRLVASDDFAYLAKLLSTASSWGAHGLLFSISLFIILIWWEKVPAHSRREIPAGAVCGKADPLYTEQAARSEVFRLYNLSFPFF